MLSVLTSSITSVPIAAETSRSAGSYRKSPVAPMICGLVAVGVIMGFVHFMTSKSHIVIETKWLPVNFSVLEFLHLQKVHFFYNSLIFCLALYSDLSPQMLHHNVQSCLMFLLLKIFKMFVSYSQRIGEFSAVIWQSQTGK